MINEVPTISSPWRRSLHEDSAVDCSSQTRQDEEGQLGALWEILDPEVTGGSRLSSVHLRVAKFWKWSHHYENDMVREQLMICMGRGHSESIEQEMAESRIAATKVLEDGIHTRDEVLPGIKKENDEVRRELEELDHSLKAESEEVSKRMFTITQRLDNTEVPRLAELERGR